MKSNFQCNNLRSMSGPGIGGAYSDLKNFEIWKVNQKLFLKILISPIGGRGFSRPNAKSKMKKLKYLII